MWSVRGEVSDAVDRLGLSSVGTFAGAEERALYSALEARFSTMSNARWIWEHLIGPSVSRQCDDGSSWVAHVARLVADPVERLLFFAGSDGEEVCVVEAVISEIVAILGECPAFEYCIAPRDLSWMLCENHHDVLVAVGSEVPDRLAALTFPAVTPT
jgi:hypothetical protein